MELNYSMSLAKRQLVDSIWKSTGIEGLGTTFLNTENILENLPVTTTRDEVLFIVNMKRAWEFTFDNIDFPNNIMFMRELHKICMNNLLYDAGQVRTGIVTIGGSTYIPRVPNTGEIIDKLGELNEYDNKLEQALDTFCYIARTQVFTDGNKRIAQMMCNKILMENDYGILSIPYNEINKFKNLLVDFYETDNNKNLKNFFKDECLLLNPEKDYSEILIKDNDDKENDIVLD